MEEATELLSQCMEHQHLHMVEVEGDKYLEMFVLHREVQYYQVLTQICCDKFLTVGLARMGLSLFSGDCRAAS